MAGPKPVALTREGAGIWEVLPGLYQAPLPTCAADWGLFWSLADVVVSLSPHADPAGFDVPEGKALVRWPFEDGPAPPRERLLPLARMLSSYLASGYSVLVHCAAGVNRSGMVVALVVRYTLAVTGTCAVRKVRERRPAALFNPSFVALVEELGDPLTEGGGG